jgi:tetratricopeptide (TPR) repeat protein
MTTERWSRGAMAVLEMGWLLCALGVPLFLSPLLSLTFTADKVLLFRVLAEGMAIAALLLWARRPCLRPQPLTLALGVYAGLLTVATVCGRDPSQSFWGSYLRLFGLFTLLHGGVLYLVVAAYFRSEDQWRRLLLYVGGLSVVMCLHALLQWRGMEQPVLAFLLRRPDFHWTAMGGESYRPFATLGNASYLGTFLVFAITFALGALVSVSRRGRWPAGALLGLLLFVLVLNQTRGAWLAVTAAAFTFALLSLPRQRRRPVLAAGAGLVLAVLLLGVAAARDPNAAWVAGNPICSRLAHFLQRDRNTSGWYRLEMWRRVGADVARTPASLLLGYGPESYQLVASRSFVPAYADGEAGAQFMDSTHNVFADTLVDGGLLGLAALLTVLLLAFRTGLRALRADPTPIRRTILITTLSALVGYIVQGMFLFNHIVTLVYLGLTLGLLAAASREWGIEPGETAVPAAGKRPRMAVIAATAGAVLLAVACFPANLRALRAQVLKRQAEELAVAGRTTEATERLREACRLVPYERAYAIHLASSLAAVPADSDPETTRAAFCAAERELRRAIALDPGDIRSYWPLGLLYQYWGALDPGKYAVGEELYRQAAALSPRRQHTYWVWGELLLKQGRREAALAKYRYALQLDPTVVSSQRALAQCYVKLRQPEQAEPYFTRAWQLARTAIPLHARSVQAADREQLGLAYRDRGRADRARTHLAAALEIDPNLPRAREALEQLSGRQALMPLPGAEPILSARSEESGGRS